MPYKNINDMPKYTHKYSDIVRRQAMHVFNSTYAKVYKETKNRKTAERRAMMAMNSVLKKRLSRTEEKNSQDYINCLVDRFLDDLHG